VELSQEWAIAVPGFLFGVSSSFIDRHGRQVAVHDFL